MALGFQVITTITPKTNKIKKIEYVNQVAKVTFNPKRKEWTMGGCTVYPASVIADFFKRCEAGILSRYKNARVEHEAGRPRMIVHEGLL